MSFQLFASFLSFSSILVISLTSMEYGHCNHILTSHHLVSFLLISVIMMCTWIFSHQFSNSCDFNHYNRILEFILSLLGPLFHIIYYIEFAWVRFFSLLEGRIEVLLACSRILQVVFSHYISKE